MFNGVDQKKRIRNKYFCVSTKDRLVMSCAAVLLSRTLGRDRTTFNLESRGISGMTKP